MRRNLIWAFVIAISILPSDMSADTVVFDFNNNTGLDNEAAGATMSATGTTDTVVLTSVGAFAQEFEETTPGVFALTGNTVACETSIGTNTNAIGVNNLSISNANFEAFKGNTSGTESGDMNLGETFTIEFDTDVVIQEFNFSSMDADGFFIVEVEGIATPFNFPDAGAADDYADPFAGMVITAGTDITFSVGGTSQDASVRITEITVDTDPGSTLLGDVDLSGQVDFLDIGPFIALLSSGVFQAEADIDLNETVDFLDIGPFIAILSGQ